MVYYIGLVKGTDDNMHSKLIQCSGITTTLLIKHVHECAWVDTNVRRMKLVELASIWWVKSTFQITFVFLVCSCDTGTWRRSRCQATTTTKLVTIIIVIVLIRNIIIIHKVVQWRGRNPRVLKNWCITSKYKTYIATKVVVACSQRQ